MRAASSATAGGTPWPPAASDVAPGVPILASEASAATNAAKTPGRGVEGASADGGVSPDTTPLSRHPPPASRATAVTRVRAARVSPSRGRARCCANASAVGAPAHTSPAAAAKPKKADATSAEQLPRGVKAPPGSASAPRRPRHGASTPEAAASAYTAGSPDPTPPGRSRNCRPWSNTWPEGALRDEARPPGPRWPMSKRVTAQPRRSSASAQARPARPPPTTATCGGGEAEEALAQRRRGSTARDCDEANAPRRSKAQQARIAAPPQRCGTGVRICDIASGGAAAAASDVASQCGTPPSAPCVAAAGRCICARCRLAAAHGAARRRRGGAAVNTAASRGGCLRRRRRSRSRRRRCVSPAPPRFVARLAREPIGLLALPRRSARASHPLRRPFLPHFSARVAHSPGVSLPQRRPPPPRPTMARRRRRRAAASAAS